MSFSRVSLFGVLATLTKLSEARVDPKLGGVSLTYLGVTEENSQYSPNDSFSLGPIPKSMAGFDGWRVPNESLNARFAAGTELTITCDNPKVDGSGGLCETFVSVHACRACTLQIDGGLKEVLRSEGWTNAQCAPTFFLGTTATTAFKMQTMRKQFADGESMTVTTTDVLSNLAVFQRGASVDCATRFSDAVSCNNAFACKWDLSGSCASSFCPAAVGAHPPAPCTCAV